jgi:hypothetical protein
MHHMLPKALVPVRLSKICIVSRRNNVRIGVPDCLGHAVFDLRNGLQSSVLTYLWLDDAEPSWLARQHEQCSLCRAVFDPNQGLRCGLENICVQAGLLSHASSVAHAARRARTLAGLACLCHQSILLCCGRTVHAMLCAYVRATPICVSAHGACWPSWPHPPPCWNVQGSLPPPSSVCTHFTCALDLRSMPKLAGLFSHVWHLLP